MKYYKKIPRIAKIEKVEPFKVTCTWNTGEVKTTDFEPLFRKWKLEEGHIGFGLTDYNIFKQVTLTETRTLCWEPIRLDGQAYDLDPIVLYEAGKLVDMPKENKVSSLLKEARLAAGLSQTELAIRSGTSKHYLSKIENGKANIEMDTLTRIIETGLGRKLNLAIE